MRDHPSFRPLSETFPFMFLCRPTRTPYRGPTLFQDHCLFDFYGGFKTTFWSIFKVVLRPLLGRFLVVLPHFGWFLGCLQRGFLLYWSPAFSSSRGWYVSVGDNVRKLFNNFETDEEFQTKKRRGGWKFVLNHFLAM